MILVAWAPQEAVIHVVIVDALTVIASASLIAKGKVPVPAKTLFAVGKSARTFIVYLSLPCSNAAQ